MLRCPKCVSAQRSVLGMIASKLTEAFSLYAALRYQGVKWKSLVFMG
jgi:hypothetical protein